MGIIHLNILKKSSNHINIYSQLIYALVYSVVVTLLTVLFSYLPTFLQIEYAIYDPIQKWTAITDQRDYQYQDSKLKLNLDEIVCINIDTSVFDLEKVRAKRENLALLLNFINKDSEPKAVFLDFLFAGKKSAPFLKNTKKKIQL